MLRINTKPFSGIAAVLPQLAPPTAPGIANVSLFNDRGTNIPVGTVSNLFFHDIRSESERKYGSRSADVIFCRLNGGTIVGNGCVGDDCSPGTSVCIAGLSSIGQRGLPVTRSN